MGVFTRLFGKSGDKPPRTRRYKVTCFGESIGAFVMPVGEHLDNPEALPRPILTRPYRADFGEYQYLCWVEPDDNGDALTVYWRPHGAEEREEADRFYRAAHGLLPDGTVDHAAQPPLVTRTVEETRLIQLALANWTDDEPLYAYADWLTRKGDPYGEFIRLTLQMAPLADDDRHRERLEERCDELLEKYGAKWVRPLTDLGLFSGHSWEDPDGFDPSWWFDDRGVIEELEIPPDTFVFRKNPARLFAGAPFLRDLHITDPALTLAAIGAIPQMAQIAYLTLYVGAGTEDDVRRFAESPHLGGLRELMLRGYNFGPPAALAFANSPWFSGLHSLDLAMNAVGDDGAEAFAGTPLGANLDSLTLESNQLQDRGLRALCASPHLAKLTALFVANNAFTVEGVRALPGAIFAPVLDTLDLSGCGLGADAIAALLAGTFPLLKSLGVSNNPMGDESLCALIASPLFRSLELFTAHDCEAGNRIAEALAGAGFLAPSELELSDNRFDDAGVATLVGSKAATKLKRLYLSGNPFGAPGVRAIATADLPNLEELEIARVNFGREGATALAKSPGLKNLTKLEVSESAIGLRGREVLLERFGEDVVSFDGC